MPDLFEIIPRQTVLLCARKGSNKYKKKRHFLGNPIVGELSKAEWATSAMPEDVMIL